MRGRYYEIYYQGMKLMSVYAPNAREAKLSAIRTYQKEGRTGINLARLEVF